MTTPTPISRRKTDAAERAVIETLSKSVRAAIKRWAKRKTWEVK